MPLPPAVAPGAVAVVTGAASGIGRAAAARLAAEGLTVALVDLPGDRLEAAAASIPGASAFPCDVADRAAVEALAGEVRKRLGVPRVLMNNAGIEPPSSCLDAANWERILGVNFLGVLHGCQAFLPAMIETGTPGLVVNTGSKQGITTPPGNPAYNASKAALKVYTEALQHELRSGRAPQISAHLLIPGFVFTGLTKATEKPPGAWTAEQTVDFLFESLSRGDFYVLCPDNEVTRALDEKRMAWAIGDIIENRPPLSRWAEGWGEKFKAFLER